jgi:hypothetical protein
MSKRRRRTRALDGKHTKFILMHNSPPHAYSNPSNAHIPRLKEEEEEEATALKHTELASENINFSILSPASLRAHRRNWLPLVGEGIVALCRREVVLAIVASAHPQHLS